MSITYIAKDFVEGAGSLYQKYLFTYLYAISKKENYIHTAAKLYKGHYQDKDLEKIESLWTLIFYPITSCVELHQLDSTGEDLIHTPFGATYKYIKSMKRNERENLFKDVRKRFTESFIINNLWNHYNQNEFIIALHLRSFGVGDINFFKNYTYPWQYFNCDYGLIDNCPEYYGKLYANAINDYLNLIEKKKIIVHIHSTASIEDLKPLISRIDPRIDIKLCGEQLAPLAFLDMICADILIASHSSFSWLALLLREKPSRIRKGFRYILPENAILLDEVLYKDASYMEWPIIFIKKVFNYLIFYPVYFFNLIRSRIYF